MSGARRPSGETPGKQLLGILLIARGQRDGLGYFRNDGDAVIAAIAPWIAMWLVALLLGVIVRHNAALLPLLAVSACLMLAPPVLTEALARLWHRRELWPRFAAATLWCEWLMIPVSALSLLIAAILTEAGTPPVMAAGAVLVVSLGYSLWLYWFLARHGLRVSRLQAGVLVLARFVVLFGLWGAAVNTIPQLHEQMLLDMSSRNAATAPVDGAAPDADHAAPHAQSGANPGTQNDTQGQTWQF